MHHGDDHERGGRRRAHRWRPPRTLGERHRKVCVAERPKPAASGTPLQSTIRQSRSAQTAQSFERALFISTRISNVQTRLRRLQK